MALTHGKGTAPEFANRCFILIDWYLRLAGGKPQAVVNKTCSWLVFDSQGALDINAALEIDAVAAPTASQWEEFRALVFYASTNYK